MHNAIALQTMTRPSAGASAAALPTMILFEALAKRLCVATTYNKSSIKLAPHILYTRHDELYLDAVTVERDGKPPKELKFGTFKLAGLVDTALTTRAFVPLRDFDAGAEKYVGVTLFTVSE
jgi:hypothetical protein